MAAVAVRFLYTELAAEIDLPAADTVEEQITHLQERRAFQLETLSARDPQELPSASLLRLRATRWDEVSKCEAALTMLGAPFESPVEEGPS
jgi:hypothetical protein